MTEPTFVSDAPKARAFLDAPERFPTGVAAAAAARPPGTGERR